jgi:NADH-quinone oxidoreductase subunit G/NADP-reducing hydrogenase subunit HndD
MEEGSEFLGRVTDAFTAPEKKAVLPMITSCSPGWIKFMEHRYPDQLAHLSSCKSPHMMLGALTKTYFAEKMNIDPASIYVVSVMPCTAKKFEITRPEMFNHGLADVDAVITTRELGRMIKDAGIDFRNLSDGEFDSPLGLSTGAADIFGTTGGVMEAALRTVYELVTGRELPMVNLHIEPLEGLDRIKTADVKIENPLEAFSFLDGVTVKVAVTSGLKGAAILLDGIKKGTSPYHFIEIMGCPGGCISGGGQPRPVNDAIRTKRLKAIYREDEGKILRKSHENQDVMTLYHDYLGVPLGHKSHELLHTIYTKRSKN